MSDTSYSITSVGPSDHYIRAEVDALLEQEGIHRDRNLDYTAAMLDEDYHVIATGSCFGNTLRCMAVSSAHQGESLMNAIVSHLVEYQYSRGNYHLFLYTKCDSARFFGSLGFSEITRVPEENIVFMENKRTGFHDYLARLAKESAAVLEALQPAEANADGRSRGGKDTRIGAIVMNANPFTLGHRYLVEKAMEACAVLHLFMVSEDASLVPFSVRRQLILDGTKDIPGIIYHDAGSYIISSATFPAYFQKGDNAVIRSQAGLDAKIFTEIAATLHITDRFVGDEPTSLVTGIYNEILSTELPKAGVTCHIIPRKESDGKAISASTVRQYMHDGKLEAIRPLVPDTTYRYFTSPEAASVLEKIRAAEDVVHY
ncbi:MAG TPA: [citrate (pro-3S)-lyase] ligase [Oribacterium sp.]|nr:[citrate (pro-3S)-lyase] ligase [Oribacterium sp.]